MLRTTIKKASASQLKPKPQSRVSCWGRRSCGRCGSSSAGNSAGLSPAAALSCAAMSARKREPSLFTYRTQTGNQETGESIGERTYQMPVRSRLHNVTICMDKNVVRSGG